MLLLFSWSAGCVASLLSSRCSDPGLPVVSFCSHQLVRATRLLQRVIPSLSWFLVQTVPPAGYAHFHAVGCALLLLLIDLACSWLCSFMFFSPPSSSVFLDARGVDDQAHHLLDRLRVTEDTHLWSIGTPLLSLLWFCARLKQSLLLPPSHSLHVLSLDAQDTRPSRRSCS